MLCRESLGALVSGKTRTLKRIQYDVAGSSQVDGNQKPQPNQTAGRRSLKESRNIVWTIIQQECETPVKIWNRELDLSRQSPQSDKRKNRYGYSRFVKEASYQERQTLQGTSSEKSYGYSGREGTCNIESIDRTTLAKISAEARLVKSLERHMVYLQNLTILKELSIFYDGVATDLLKTRGNVFILYPNTSFVICYRERRRLAKEENPQVSARN